MFPEEQASLVFPGSLLLCVKNQELRTQLYGLKENHVMLFCVQQQFLEVALYDHQQVAALSTT
jgi:hypothetical protein